jgi:hemerythrin
MTKVYTPEQQQFIREARKEYCEFATEIDKAKAEHKAIFEALVDRLGLDPKEQKEDIKSLKRGFAIYYKETQDEEESVVSGAVEIARM